MNPNQLLKTYTDYCKNVDKNRLHTAYFKVILKVDGDKCVSDAKVFTNDDYEKVLDILQTVNFYNFFQKNTIIVENYNIDFFVNSKGDYFIKLELLYPQLGALLEYKNSQCIYPECNDTIINYADFFCNNHLKSEIIDNFDEVNKYFLIRAKELEEMYCSYKNQFELYNYLKEKGTGKGTGDGNGLFLLEADELDNVKCYLELIDNSSAEGLVEIELNSMINNLDCMILNDSYTFGLDDSETRYENENEQEDCLIENMSELDESDQELEMEINQLDEILNSMREMTRKVV